MKKTYQWPSEVIRHEAFDKSLSNAGNAALYDEIEAFFTDRYGIPLVLMPSGRASLGAIFRHLKLGRGQSVLAPRWSTDCIWTTIGNYTNATLAFESNPECVLAVHRWSYVHSFAKKPTGVVVEDSVDSIFADKSAFFPNGGRFELVSLPKVLGTFSGALVFTRDKAFIETCRAERARDPKLASHQSLLKNQAYRDEDTGFETWETHEHHNTALDANGLFNIKKNLSKWDENARVIEKRREQALKVFKGEFRDEDAKRFGPNFKVTKKKASADPRLVVRHFNTSRLVDQPKFDEVFLLPLHFGVSDQLFGELLEAVKKSS